MSLSLKSLIGKLNETTRKALEAAAGLCVTRTHYDVEIEHFLIKLLDEPGSDSSRIYERFGVDTSRLSADLTRSLDRLRTGNARTPSLSPSLVRMFTDAWTTGSIELGATDIRSGLAILALATQPELARMVTEVSPEFAKIQGSVLHAEFASIVAASNEGEMSGGAAEGATPAGIKAGGKTPNLNQFTIDLTANAKAGKIDPVLGRDSEVRQIIDILMRRRQNNPILTGEAGVGKTAVVEGFALRVAGGYVPPPLRNVVVRTLDLALLQAGAGVKGEFENRLKGLIEEVKSSPVPIILFIDEAHTMIGAGGQAGQGDAANLLKPALARGELRTIAATTWSEYKRYFEKDAALARRFQVVKVEEPGEIQCMVMLRGIVPSLEKHHGVRILDEGLGAAVRLSHRYLAGRQLPDKAVSVLDTACARLALGQSATPPAIEDATRQMDDLNVQERILTREAAVGANHAERLEQIAAEKANVEKTLASLGERWEKEKQIVTRLRELRTALETAAGAKPLVAEAPPTPEPVAAPVGSATDGAAATAPATTPAGDPAALRAEMEKLNAELSALQGETPLMRVCVDEQIVAEVVAAWTGIPVGKMVKDEIAAVLELATFLGKRVVGQTHSLETIARRIVTSKARLDDPNRPIGVFMLVGPSGVGKTETALALSDLFYGGEKNMITINMSEFQEAHTVSTLKGSPPGYVGYGEGGVLTEAVRRRPYSVVLLDEVEKAHPDVLELFYQVFDKGMMEDGEGREIDFKNTILILTSNAGTETLMKLTSDPDTMPGPEGLVKALKPELDKVFKPAFLGRMVIVPYFPVRDEILKQIIVLKLDRIRRRILENHKVHLTWDDAVLSEIAKRCTEIESGARNIDSILTNTVLPEISRQMLGRMAAGEPNQDVHVSVMPEGGFVYS